MNKLIRLDKFLSDMKIASRREIKEYGKKGRIKVNGIISKSTDIKIDTTKDIVSVDENEIKYQQFEYYMLNKPAGIVSATTDNIDTTVIDLFKSEKSKDLFPVGRLDKDTVGLLLITNDGVLAHNLLSPSKHIDKTYFVRVEGRLDKDAKEKFANGIKLNDGTVTKPAELIILKDDEISEVKVTISEGKFHQVKRMIADVGGKVLYLKRLSMGKLLLDDKLIEGEYRRLSEDEIDLLKR